MNPTFSILHFKQFSAWCKEDWRNISLRASMILLLLVGMLCFLLLPPQDADSSYVNNGAPVEPQCFAEKREVM